MKRHSRTSIAAIGLVVASLGAGLGAGASLAADVPDDAMDVCPLPIRSEIPDVAMRTADGADFDLAAAVKKKPSILIFYRGGW